MELYRLTSDLNLREEPNKDAASKGVFSLGTVVEGFETNPEGTWIRVRIPAGPGGAFHEGWMSLRFLARLTAEPLTWRLGINLREFAYYGSGALGVKNTSASLRAKQLETCRDIGVKLVRFFGSRLQFSADESIPFIRAALDEIAAFGMKAIVCLEDSLTGAEQQMPGNEKFHNASENHLNVEFWRNRIYQQTYLPAMRKIVTAFRNDPTILMWELGNEFGLYPPPPGPGDDPAFPPKIQAGDHEHFLNFVKAASQEIKQIAPNHLVALGLISSHHVYDQASDDDGKRRDWAKRLYSLASVDAVGVHFYRNNFHELERFIKIDYEVATRDLGKPFYVGEIGAQHGEGGRPEFYSKTIEHWKGEGAFTVMPWQLDTSPFDVGVCDHLGFGFWRDKHQDYGAILDAIKSQA